MIVVFLGPTIPVEEARSILDAVYLPPVSQGDVLRAAREGPTAIGIIDGYFERVPAVWHKEILWALSEGIHVLGAASMGALRAAELEAFGMVGVGEIFEAFRDGRLTDDDEVAVVHGPAEDGYRACSEAMVDIRATLARAASEGVIADPVHQRLEAIAKSLYYPRRSYPAVLERAAASGTEAEWLDRLRSWLATGRVEQKRADARALLSVLAGEYGAGCPPKRTHFVFQHTEIFEHAVRRSGRLAARDPAGPEASELLLDELRLRGLEAFRRHRDAAQLRALALAEARRQGAEVQDEALGETIEAFRRRRGLRTREATEAWLFEQGLDPETFYLLMMDETRLDRVRRTIEPETARQLAAELRVRGSYAVLEARARAKRCAPGAAAAASLEDTGLSEQELLAWYFTERLGQEVPEDLEGYAADLDLPGSDVLLEILVREYLFLRSRAVEAPSAAPGRASG